MTKQIKAALRGDAEAAAECTNAGIAIPCGNCANRRTPKCGVCVVTPSAQGSVDKLPSRWELDDQSLKADVGKPHLTLVPNDIIFAIARVREYGVDKYKTVDGWRDVSVERYRNAAYRHWLAYLDDPQGVDDESGLPHLHHAACNIAFLVALEGGHDQNL